MEGAAKELLRAYALRQTRISRIADLRAEEDVHCKQAADAPATVLLAEHAALIAETYKHRVTYLLSLRQARAWSNASHLTPRLKPGACLWRDVPTD